MHYSFDFAIPTNTLEVNKISLACPVNYGMLREVEIFFPWGCAGLVHVQIHRFQRQIFPSNPDSNYSDNDYHLKFEEYYPVLELPYELIVKGWNLDDYFEHTITFRFSVIHPSAISAVSGTPITQEELAALLGTYEIVGGG